MFYINKKKKFAAEETDESVFLYRLVPNFLIRG